MSALPVFKGRVSNDEELMQSEPKSRPQHKNIYRRNAKRVYSNPNEQIVRKDKHSDTPT